MWFCTAAAALLNVRAVIEGVDADVNHRRRRILFLLQFRGESGGLHGLRGGPGIGWSGPMPGGVASRQSNGDQQHTGAGKGNRQNSQGGFLARNQHEMSPSLTKRAPLLHDARDKKARGARRQAALIYFLLRCAAAEASGL